MRVAYSIWVSPIGPLLVAVSPGGLVRVGLPGEDHGAILDDLAHRLGGVEHDPTRTDPVVAELAAYLDGALRSFTVQVDLSGVQGFRRDVLEHLRTIPYGVTETYSEVAAGAGRPGAARAAGTACARNPVPIVVACHRVVRSDGTIGRYGGGADLKERLLALEAPKAGRTTGSDAQT